LNTPCYVVLHPEGFWTVALAPDCITRISRQSHPHPRERLNTGHDPAMGEQFNNGLDSRLFQPLSIADGRIQLKHRVIHAPLTRNRGTPLSAESTEENPNRIWIPNDLVAKYYEQRTTEGGLLISEGLPPSLEVVFTKTPVVQGGSRADSIVCCPGQWHAWRPRNLHPGAG